MSAASFTVLGTQRRKKLQRESAVRPSTFSSWRLEPGRCASTMATGLLAFRMAFPPNLHQLKKPVSPPAKVRLRFSSEVFR